MTDKELAATLRTAAQSVDNIALKMLLQMAADRIETCEALARTVMLDQTAHDNYTASKGETK
jgi:hypothetical protein